MDGNGDRARETLALGNDTEDSFTASIGGEVTVTVISSDGVRTLVASAVEDGYALH